MTPEANVAIFPETRPQTHSDTPSEPVVQRRGRWFAVLIVLAALAAGGVYAWRTYFGPTAPQGIVSLSGRIEADDSIVSPKTGGRILEIRAREGDTLKAGDTIAVLDDEQVRAREERARAALAEAESRAGGARQQLAALEAQLRQSALRMGQSKVDAEGRVRQAEADLATAQAQLVQQQSSYQLALFDK